MRELARQISSQAYQNLRGKGVTSGSRTVKTAADDEIRDPFVLQSLNLRDVYSESDLESALVTGLVLELGNDFAFIARQRRLRVGTEWYRVDLLLFHRSLRFLVAIDLKIGKFTTQRCRPDESLFELWTPALVTPPLIPRAQFAQFHARYPQVKVQNLYTRLRLRSQAYLAARPYRASAR